MIILISVTERTAGCLVSSISCVPTVKPITQIETLSGKISPSPSPGCDDAGSCPVPSDRQLHATGRGGAGRGWLGRGGGLDTGCMSLAPVYDGDTLSSRGPIPSLPAPPIC